MTENNRNAKYYRLTRAGRRQLEREANRWNAIADAIAAVLREA
jgi:DNA-binding PadR family transcriptional regulator